MKILKNNFYKVQKNDTLSSIAKAYGMHPTEFLMANNISPKAIFEGNILYITHID